MVTGACRYFRAISLWQFWSSELPEAARLNRLNNQDGDPLFSVSGYGETRPVNDQQSSEEDYRLNRRIDILHYSPAVERRV